jgi:hypothetical protein
MNTKIFLLHHLPVKERKEKLLEDLAAVNLQYPVVWVENFLPEDIKDVYQFRVNIANASLNLKHRYVHEYIINNNIDYGIVLEDDIDLLSVHSLQLFLEKCIEEIKQHEGDILWIGGTNELQAPQQFKIPGTLSVFYEGLDSRCTHGYIITPKAAKIVFDNFHLNLPIDHLFNEVIRNNKQIKSGWTDPFLRQKTVEGKWPSLLK